MLASQQTSLLFWDLCTPWHYRHVSRSILAFRVFEINLVSSFIRYWYYCWSYAARGAVQMQHEMRRVLETGD